MRIDLRIWSTWTLILATAVRTHAQTQNELAPDSAYHPYPIVFVHGLNGAADHWGLRYGDDDERPSNDAVRVKDRYVKDGYMLKLMGPYFAPYHRQTFSIDPSL